MDRRGRPREYKTAAALEKAVNRYFASITRMVAVKENIFTGEKDKDGHDIYRSEPVLNALGEIVYITEYIIPPEISGLCEALKIHRSTWSNYCDSEKHPEFRKITEDVYERLKAWNEHELLTRPGKDLKGIMFNLENNYGYREKQSIEVGGGIEDYLKRLSEKGGGAQEF